MISESVLLEGSWYALEQAGRLLRAAVGVYDRGDSATALALAMFGREEIGRSRILRTLANEVANGASFSAQNVTDRCDDHVKKQREGATGTTLRVPPQSQLAKALQAQANNAPGSSGWKAARAVISAATTSKAKRDPQDRHDMREKALYVDLASDSKSWCRPSMITPTVAREHIEEAVNDYAIECYALRDEVIADDFPSMAKTRERMKPHPVLIAAIWPSGEHAD
ncbi:MAG: AbiV family abortive infection protein [Nitrospira sp.]|nr:AbiV family abortive infection protein [Nitrospira sp.]